MSKAKTRKSITKRFKITRTGKILRRVTGVDHFRAKKSGKQIRNKKKMVEVYKGEARKIKKILKYIKYYGQG